MRSAHDTMEAKRLTVNYSEHVYLRVPLVSGGL